MGVRNGHTTFQHKLENPLEPVCDCADTFVGSAITARRYPNTSYDKLLDARDRGLTKVLDWLVGHKHTGSNDKATITISEVVIVGQVYGSGHRKPRPGNVAAIEHRERAKTVS